MKFPQQPSSWHYNDKWRDRDEQGMRRPAGNPSLRDMRKLYQHVDETTSGQGFISYDSMKRNGTPTRVQLLSSECYKAL